jgi:hypothetical protein
MQGIGVLLKNGGRRPPIATFSHKGRRKGSSLNNRFIKIHHALGTPRAFSSEVDTGSREENASNKKLERRF